MYGGYVLIENLLLGSDIIKLQGASFVWSMLFLSITLLQLDFFDREEPQEIGMRMGFATVRDVDFASLTLGDCQWLSRPFGSEP